MANVPEQLKYDRVTSVFQELYNERSYWETEWRVISDYLMPGRGIFDTTTRPAKRRLSSPKIVNSTAQDAAEVLVSEIYGRLTSPSRPWFELEWTQPELNALYPLRAWMQEANRRMENMFQVSNFYEAIVAFYEEYIGFGTASMYVGEDTGDDDLPIWFYTFTIGEFYLSIGRNGKPDQYIRTIYLTEKQLIERFGDAVDKETIRRVEQNRPGINTPKQLILEYLVNIPYDSQRPWSRIMYQMMGPNKANSFYNLGKEPLEYSGFYEFPYPTARFSTIRNDVYGIGLGTKTLPDNKRLQQMEKAFLMAVHKSADPPVNAPARMKGKLNTLPGAYNYYSNPQELVKELYQVRVNFEGLGVAIERVENRIKKGFYNDIFLTTSRDPNATPYKATEAAIRDQEKLLRLGPLVERLQYEFLQPLIERCFNIMLRKDLFPVLPPEYAEMVAEYNINIISPLATAQRGAALQGMNSFLAFVGQAAQYSQEALDKVNIDGAIDEYANITGTDVKILNDDKRVAEIRKTRAEAMKAEKDQQNQLAMAQIQAELELKKAQTAKLQSEAIGTSIEGQETAQQIGLA